MPLAPCLLCQLIWFVLNDGGYIDLIYSESVCLSFVIFLSNSFFSVSYYLQHSLKGQHRNTNNIPKLHETRCTYKTQKSLTRV